MASGVSRFGGQRATGRRLALVALLALVACAIPARMSGQASEPSAWTEEDWAVLGAKVRWGAAERLDSLPVGAAIARLGETFVGATYTPATLEVPGPERVVVNLRELDCVTFIENVLALVRFIREDGVAALADSAAARRRYESYLRDIRYRGGTLEGYPSRLHYFSEWLGDNAVRGRLVLRTGVLDGVEDPEPVNFMSTHPEAYRQLADPAVLAAIGGMERRLNGAGPRLFIPQDRIAAAESGIADGDLIAATSTVPGLDIAHTGIALWRDGRLHLLHAPLVGKVVEISELPLAERIQGILGQDGIMVARVLRP